MVYRIFKEYNFGKLRSNKINQSLREKSILETRDYKFVKEYIQPPQVSLAIPRINNELNKKFGVKTWRESSSCLLKMNLIFLIRKEAQQH